MQLLILPPTPPKKPSQGTGAASAVLFQWPVGKPKFKRNIATEVTRQPEKCRPGPKLNPECFSIQIPAQNPPLAHRTELDAELKVSSSLRLSPLLCLLHPLIPTPPAVLKSTEAKALVFSTRKVAHLRQLRFGHLHKRQPSPAPWLWQDFPVSFCFPALSTP